MADSDKTLELLIKLGVIGQEDARAAKQLLDDYAPATDKAAEATEKLTVNHRSLHGILHLIGREAGPAAGAAVAAATALMTGGTYAAIIAIRELFQWFDSLRKKAEEFREQQASMWLAAQQGAQDATESAHEFAEKLNDAATKGHTLETSYDKQLKLLHDQIKAHKDLLEALEKEALAAAHGDKAAEDAVRTRFGALKAAYNIQSTGQLIGTEQEQITGAKADAYRQAVTAQQFETQREETLKTIDALSATAPSKDKLKELKAKADHAEQLQKEADAFGDQPSYIAGEMGTQIVTPAGAARFLAQSAKGDIAKYNEGQSAFDQLTFAQSQLKDFTAGRDKAVGAFGADETKIDALTNSLDELTISLKEMNRERLLGATDPKTGQTLGGLMAGVGYNTAQEEAVLNALIANHMATISTVFKNLEDRLIALQHGK